jgi:subtilisin family serine protease
VTTPAATVTLITGDKVTTNADGGVEVRDSRGELTGYLSGRKGGDTYVYPHDALPDLASLSSASSSALSPARSTLAGSGVKKIWLDGTAKAALADSTAQIGAPEVWQKGDTGRGVDVAVLDTGIDTAHCRRSRSPSRRTAAPR